MSKSIVNKNNLHTILKKYYGFDEFRPPQEEIIENLCNGNDLLVLMPTGGGKSLCYQIPSLYREGVGIVVSPLISLMEDQVQALKLLGINADFYNSSLSSNDAKKVLAKLHTNTLDLLYIAPERLLSAGFMERLSECKIALFAIDEAHCISQWGHDFRPEYRALGILKKNFQEVPIIALTATADKQTREDIIRQLQYKPQTYVVSFNRPNIYYDVKPKQNGFKQLKEFLATRENQSGIIYCGTRANVEDLCEQLVASGVNAKAYHAGLSHNKRKEVQSEFRYDKIEIVVATIAFGMGIDKPNVRFVVHYDLPKTIENYYQETGRAGRDGMPAVAFMLYNPGDSARIRAFINQLENENQQRIENNKLNYLLAFAESTHCRRQVLLQYFDEPCNEPCKYCDVCDNPPETVDVTTDAQKLLSCIYRLKQSYGLGHVVDVLRGSTAQKILKTGGDKLSTYGIGKDKSQNYWKNLFWQLVNRALCYQDIGHYNVLKLTKAAIPVLRGETKIFLPVYIEKTTKAKKAISERKQKLDYSSNPLFVSLRKLRKELADSEGKPPFMIFSDATLHEMVHKLPSTLEEMHEISGVGDHKLLKYGEIFLDAICDTDVVQ